MIMKIVIFLFILNIVFGFLRDGNVVRIQYRNILNLQKAFMSTMSVLPKMNISSDLSITPFEGRHNSADSIL